jgi:hypothetical protein
MNYFDPNRPTNAAGHRTFLKSGDIIPALQILPYVSDNNPPLVRIWAYLRNFEHGFSYSAHTLIVEPKDLPEYLAEFVLDPELFCQTHFDWTDQPVTGSIRLLKPLAPALTQHRALVGSDLASAEELF